MHAVAGLIALNAAFLGCGYGLLRMLGRRLAFADAGLAFCAGVAALVGACSLLAVAGYVPGVPVACGLAVVGAAPALLAIRRSMFRLPRGGAVAWLRLDIVSTAVVAAAACTYAVATLVVSSVKFLDEWDAWSMWTLKAKGLVVFGSLSTADFAGSAHPDYPIFVPMLQSLTFRFMGSFDTKLVHVEHALLAIAFAGAATRLLSGRLPRPALVAIGLVLLAAPGVARNVPDALADVPVAVFVALAGLTLALWLTYDAPTLGLFVLFAAAAAWTKDEGLASVAAICVAALPLAARSPTKRRLGRFAAAVGGVALLYLPWHFWKAAHGAVYDTSLTQGVSLHFFSERGHAAVRALHAMWSQLGDLSLWVAVPYALVAVSVCLVVLRRDVRLAVFAVLAPVLAFLLYVWVYAIRSDPLGLSWTLDTTVTRVTTSVGLLATTLLAVELAALLGEPDSVRDGP